MTCEECVYAGYCALASLRGYDPCDTFEKRQDHLRQEEAERMYEVTSDIHRKRVKDIETNRLPPRSWGGIRMN
jgi:hypothetical protein